MTRPFLKRIPGNYDGLEPTGRTIEKLLPKALSHIGERQKIRPDLILAAWQKCIGPKAAKMTKAVSFNDGVLYVKVSNSALLSVLIHHEKIELLNKLKRAFPKAVIRDISFRMG